MDRKRDRRVPLLAVAQVDPHADRSPRPASWLPAHLGLRVPLVVALPGVTTMSAEASWKRGCAAVLVRRGVDVPRQGRAPEGRGSHGEGHAGLAADRGVAVAVELIVDQGLALEGPMGPVTRAGLQTDRLGCRVGQSDAVGTKRSRRGLPGPFETAATPPHAHHRAARSLRAVEQAEDHVRRVHVLPAYRHSDRRAARLGSVLLLPVRSLLRMRRDVAGAGHGCRRRRRARLRTIAPAEIRPVPVRVRGIVGEPVNGSRCLPPVAVEAGVVVLTV